MSECMCINYGGKDYSFVVYVQLRTTVLPPPPPVLSQMNSIQNQMESKGGYESSMPVPSEHTPHGIDVVVSLREAP